MVCVVCVCKGRTHKTHATTNINLHQVSSILNETTPLSPASAAGVGAVNKDTGHVKYTRMGDRSKRERFSLLMHASLAVLALVEIGLAASVGHMAGIVLGVLGLVVAAVGGVAWLRRWTEQLTGSGKAVNVMWNSVRGFLLVLLTLFVVVRAMSADPDWSSYPADCERFKGMDNCARVGEAPYGTEGLSAPRIRWRPLDHSQYI